MSLYIDILFIGRIGVRLRNFKRKSDYLWNCSCVFCGDSKTDLTKARGYIYRVQGNLNFKCHNCGMSCNLGNLIRKVSEDIYQEYVMERYKDGIHAKNDHKDPFGPGSDSFFKAKSRPLDLSVKDRVEDQLLDDVKRFIPQSKLNELMRCDSFKQGHPVRMYLEGRMIPEEFYSRLFVAPKFKAWTNSIIKDKFQSPIYSDHPRLVIPLIDVDGRIFGYGARAFGDEQPKYYTIKLNESDPKIFGLDRVDLSQTVYVTEGQFDSMFVDNCVAVSGASFITPWTQENIDKCVLIYDNEPRNSDICKQLNKAIEAGFKVVMFPEAFVWKDINDAIKDGLTKDDIKRIIQRNTFDGLDAKLKFSTWRKVNI